jgi:catechol-2,3-dioxygenase
MKTFAGVDRLRQLNGNTEAQRQLGRNGQEPKREREKPQVIGVGHVALSARHPVALAEFYRHVLGLQVVPTETSDLGENVFLSGDLAGGSIDLALFANPDFQHTAFEVRSLADLRAFHQRVLRRGVHVKMALNHGVSLSFYFHDPEGHLIEVYWSTGIDCLPRHGDPIDLTLSEEALRRDVAVLAARAALTN